MVVSIVLWTVTSITIALFQCKMPGTWKFIGNTCINHTALWNYSNVFNLLLDACLIILPVTLVWNLRLNRTHRIVVIACFLARIVYAVPLSFDFLEFEPVLTFLQYSWSIICTPCLGKPSKEYIGQYL